MSDTFLPFCRPHITPDDIAAVTGVLQSGWITTGAKTAALEQAFVELTGARYAVAGISATALMHLYMVAKHIGPGDEVITPSLTWVSTVNLITLMGATPVFVDVERDNLMTTADRIAAAITPRTKLIVPVHFAGAPLDIEPVRALASERGVALVEDAAHVLGAMYKGKPMGSSGDAIFSLQAIKNITSAEGGVFTTDDAALADRIRRLRFHGLGVDSFDRETQGRSPQAEVIEPGFKYNLPDMCSVLALNQMQRLDKINARRAQLAQRYLELLRDVPQAQPLVPPSWQHQHAWHLFVVRIVSDNFLSNKMSRNEFIERMKAEKIGCGIHFRAIHEQKFYREAIERNANNIAKRFELPNTEWNSARICSLPLFPDMSDSDVDRVVAAMKKILVTA